MITQILLLIAILMVSVDVYINLRLTKQIERIRFSARTERLLAREDRGPVEDFGSSE